MAESLKATSSGPSQNTTQDPQAAGTSAGGGTQASAVQPGGENNLFNSTGGVPLTQQKLSTVALKPTTGLVVKPDVPQRHTSPVLVGTSAVLFIIAVVLIISTFLPTKNTTE